MVEGEHCLPECCACVVDIDFYLSCHGDDGKNCGFDGNDILCEFIDSDNFLGGHTAAIAARGVA